MEQIQNVTVLNHPLIKTNLAVLRDKNSDCELFNLALKRISYALFYEASKYLPTETIKVQTPIIDTENEVIKKDIDVIIAPVLRAGLVFSDIAQWLLPFSHVHHLGMYRNEETLEPIWYYNKMKGKFKNLDKTYVFILDPMLATGNSGYDAVHNFVKQGIDEKNIVFISLICAPEGIKKLTGAYKNLKIITAQVDLKLNERGYIVPGLGDAGDRIFNTL
ncbi:MAG: uracil phosphoribosyltransferase [Candidatus Gastranaerophilales bacterium]|nr:uracil phosphoribosyltransferase [Candidatus Gastranaerophilales bacterium]